MGDNLIVIAAEWIIKVFLILMNMIKLFPFFYTVYMLLSQTLKFFPLHSIENWVLNFSKNGLQDCKTEAAYFII